MSMKRLQKEYTKLQNGNEESYSVMLEGENLHEWTVMLMGPADTPYAGGVFHLSLSFPPEYPFKAPKVQFKTKIYHPNIKSDGQICADAIEEGWAPTRNAQFVIGMVQELLRNPNASNPLEADIGKVFSSNRAQFDKTAAEWTASYAQ